MQPSTDTITSALPVSEGTSLLHAAVSAALLAGNEIRSLQQNTRLGLRFKKDFSPVTKSDKIAQEIILHALKETGIPVVSEESALPAYAERKTWSTFWLVDPLDGTIEYIHRRKEYTVNIALVREGNPLLGVVYAPALNRMYYGDETSGSFLYDACDDKTDFIQIISRSVALPVSRTSEYTIVASRSHINRETRAFIRRMKSEKNDVRVIGVGSSLKLCLIAEGSADIYPRFGRTMEWDIAAGHALLVFSGGKICEIGNGDQPLKYNKPVMENPSFIAFR